VKIPAGVDTGTRVQLAAQGEVGPGGGPPGDLYVEMHVNEHPVFVRHGSDLLCTVTVPMTAAALGTTLDMPTLEADIASEESDVETSFSLTIPAGTQSGTETVHTARGIPSLRGGGRGDLVVRVVVETPTRLDDRQEELLAELAVLRGEESPDGRMTSSHTSVFDRLRKTFGQR
jgi:molecular chaperone DnaJ